MMGVYRLRKKKYNQSWWRKFFLKYERQNQYNLTSKNKKEREKEKAVKNNNNN